MYIVTWTRPDIAAACAVVQLAMCMAQPSKLHLSASRHVLRQGSTNCIVYGIDATDGENVILMVKMKFLVMRTRRWQWQEVSNTSCIICHTEGRIWQLCGDQNRGCSAARCLQAD